MTVSASVLSLNNSLTKKYTSMTKSMPAIAEGIRTAKVFKPKSATDKAVSYIYTGSFQSPKDWNETGRNLPYSSFPVWSKEYAL